MGETENEPLMNSNRSSTHRDALLREWVRSLHRLLSLSKTNVSQAIIEGTLYDIEECAGLGIPIVSIKGEWGIRYLDAPEGGFAIVPLIENDCKLHPYFATQIKGPVYREQARAIFLPPDQLSEIWRGLILIHEVNHAMKHQDRVYRAAELDHWVEEYQVYIEEIELVTEIFGQPYERAIQELSQTFEEQLKTGKLRLETGKQVPEEVLQELFGKANSELERNMQRGLVIIDGLYKALDHLDSNGDKREHYTITEWFTTSSANSNN